MTTPRTLPAELTIYTVGEFKGQCLAWMSETPTDSESSGDHWPIDARAVDQIDAAGVQLLVALSHTLSGQGQTLWLQDASAPLAQGCSALGLDDWLAAHTPEGAPA